jgi:diamine oxidase
VPGVDCPEGATFLDSSFLSEGMQEPVTLYHSMCVFEQNTGIPLRRHMSYSRNEGAFFGGMQDTQLVMRTIMTIFNYDYIVDFIFFQVLRRRGVG